MKNVTIIQTKRNGWFIPELKAKLTWDFNDNSDQFENDYSEDMNFKNKYSHSTTLENASDIVKEWYSLKKENADLKKELIEKEFQEKLNHLLSLPVIPTNIENLKIIIRYLNKQNWGSWNLPQMSIGYKASQYNCDGITATTITLDEPISDKQYEIIIERKFSFNAPHRHLEKYREI